MMEGMLLNGSRGLISVSGMSKYSCLTTLIDRTGSVSCLTVLTISCTLLSDDTLKVLGCSNLRWCSKLEGYSCIRHFLTAEVMSISGEINIGIDCVDGSCLVRT